MSSGGSGYSVNMECNRIRSALATLLLFCFALGCQPPAPTPVEPGTATQAPAAVIATPEALRPSGPGFRSQGSFEDHYSKHGREFGSITADQYLALAQRLRDAQVDDTVLEIVREVDGVITRFDRSNQHFGAYNRDGTIRTFFIPNDGESYFRRQALRRPQ